MVKISRIRGSGTTRYVKKKRFARRKGGLVKRVKRLERDNRMTNEYLTLAQATSNAPVAQDFYSLNLCNYVGMTSVFGTAGSHDLHDNKVIHNRIYMKCRVSLESNIAETNTIGFTAYLVSLKDEIGSAFNPATGGLSLSTLNHFYTSQGLCQLNKKCFTIHKQRNFTLTNYGQSLTTSSAQSQFGTDYRWTWVINPRKVIKNTVGNWSDLSSAQDPSKQYYILIFNDNSPMDLENPGFTCSIIHTMKKCN